MNIYKFQIHSYLKISNFLSFIFLSMIFFVLTLVGIGFFSKNVAGMIGLKEKKFIYNAVENYPFESNILVDCNKYVSKKKYQKKNHIISIENKITLNCTEYLPGRMYFVVVKKKIDKFLGFDMTTSMGVINAKNANDVVTSFDGEWLGSPMPEGSNMCREEHIRSVVNFYQKMKSEGRNFFVFENPSKFCDQIGYKNTYFENRETVNFALKNNGIEILDLDDYIKENGIDYKEIFLKTDHHWQPRSGLWANKLLCNYLNKYFNYEIDTSVFDISNYDVKVYKNQFLGSLGKKVTEVYSGKEDFELIIPKFNSDITAFSSETGKTKTGTIKDVFYYMDVFKEKNVYSRNEYALYTNNANVGLIISHNNFKNDGSNLLLIHLSFADVQIPFLTQVFENFYAVDLRYFNGSLATLIKEINPSTVVLAYPTSEFQKDTSNTFMRDMFNFN